jgi:hypothetical protein
MVAIPKAAPSSVHLAYGSVKYNVRIKFDRPWAIDYEFVEGFTVVHRFDLNLNPILRNPAENTITKEFGFCCWESYPMSFTVTIPKRGFAPGEMVDLKAHINNPTSTGNFTKKKNQNYLCL